MTKSEMVAQNVVRFRSINYGEWPKYILVNPQFLNELKAEQPGPSSICKEIKFMGIPMIESEMIDKFYIVKEFENQFYHDERKQQIMAAIDRFIEADKPIPVDWIVEYNEICNRNEKQIVFKD